MNILITGANGFIGRSLCAKILSCGWHARGTVRSGGKDKLFIGIEPVRVERINAFTDWTDVLHDIDIVVHLAARAHVMKETADDPLETFREVNTKGTERLARMAANARVRRFIYISSIGVNGEQTDDKPFTEDDIPNPTQAYAVSKWEAEKLLLEISANTGMDVVILRPPLVYGPGAKGNVLKLMDYVYRQLPLPFGGIHNRRSFIGLENLIDAIMLTIKRPEAAGQTFLVSDGEDISTLDLIRMIAGYMCKETRIFNVPRSFFTWSYRFFPSIRKKLVQLTGSLVVDSSKFKKMMHWIPPHTLEEGIKDMVSDYLSRSRNRVS